jgi:Tol biopolymer transport system component
MFLYSFDSGQYEQLTENSQATGGFPQWLADSRRVLFASGSTIQLMDTRTRRIRQIYAAPDWISRMTISRDNRLICFRHGIAESDIWMATLDTE